MNARPFVSLPVDCEAGSIKTNEGKERKGKEMNAGLFVAFLVALLVCRAPPLDAQSSLSFAGEVWGDMLLVVGDVKEGEARVLTENITKTCRYSSQSQDVDPSSLLARLSVIHANGTRSIVGIPSAVEIGCGRPKIVTLEGIRNDLKHRWEVLDASSPSPHTVLGFVEFRGPPSSHIPSGRSDVAFLSCNRIVDDPNDAVMWRLLMDSSHRQSSQLIPSDPHLPSLRPMNDDSLCDGFDVRTIFHLGDQIYADKVPKLMEHRSAHFGSVLNVFRDFYRVSWSHPAVFRVLRCTSNVMLADDHEFINNFRHEFLRLSPLRAPVHGESLLFFPIK